MGSAEIESFLTHLAVDQNVAASTQNQAFSALLFLYREVLHKDSEIRIDSIRAGRILLFVRHRSSSQEVTGTL